MKYLSVNDQHLLLGSQFILKNRDYKMSTDYKTFLNEYKTIYTVAVREGIALKGGGQYRYVCMMLMFRFIRQV